MMLLFNHQAGFAIGVDLGVKYVSCLLTDLAGHIHYRERIRLNATAPDDVLDQISSLIHKVINEAPRSPYGIIGIGVGVPGIVDDLGTIISAPNLGWKNIPFRQSLEQQFTIPIVIDNEANVGAIGEKEFGIGRDVHHLIYISAGTGIGTGLVIHNKIFRGASGYSGELGHMTIQSDRGLLCSCGNRGCWEMYASENTLLHRAQTEVKCLSSQSSKVVDIDTLVELAAQGNQEVIHLFNDIGRYLGIGIANAINAFNPEMIVIGNRLRIAKAWLEPSLFDTVAHNVLNFHQDRARIEFAALQLDSVTMGAASMAISQFIASCKVSYTFSQSNRTSRPVLEDS
jgi:glucokinase-like ROK family protein